MNDCCASSPIPVSFAVWFPQAEGSTEKPLGDEGTGKGRGIEQGLELDDGLPLDGVPYRGAAWAAAVDLQDRAIEGSVAVFFKASVPRTHGLAGRYRL